MPVIDDRGRLFGRVNVLDAAFIALFFLLLPLGYAAYLLFRTPVPQIVSVEPTTMPPGVHRLRLAGKNFRPYLRVAVGITMAEGFLVESPSRAEIQTGDLGPGTHDIVMFDASLEVARLPGAVTVVTPPSPLPPSAPLPPPIVQSRPGRGLVQALGTFLDLDARDTRIFGAGRRLVAEDREPVAEIVAVRPAEPAMMQIKTGDGASVAAPVSGKVQVPAIVSLRCLPVADDCQIEGISVTAGQIISLPKPNGTVAFRIRELRPLGSPPVFPQSAMADVLVRFVGRPEVLPLLQPGARDIDRRMRMLGGPPVASLISVIGKPIEFPSRSNVNVGLDVPPSALSFYEVSDRIATLEARLRVPVEKSLDDWLYKGVAVKLGAPLTFETNLYVVRGSILQVSIGPATVSTGP